MMIRSLLITLGVLVITGFGVQDENIEFICMKKHFASKTCHYNFKVDGAKYRYVDIGCKEKSTKEVIEQVKAGDLALAKDWKIPCPEPKGDPK